MRKNLQLVKKENTHTWLENGKKGKLFILAEHWKLAMNCVRKCEKLSNYCRKKKIENRTPFFSFCSLLFLPEEFGLLPVNCH